MDQPNDPAERELDAAHEEVKGILRLQKRWWRQAERVVGVMTGFQDIVGLPQDAGRDRPFDLRAGDDSLRIDVKTQDDGELDVKKEKVGKQYQAWVASGRRFVPVQVVLDSQTEGWYVVAGIPTASKTPLDPLDTQFDPTDPGKPFCIGKCSRKDLGIRERFAEMRVKLTKALQDVRENGEVVRAKVDREYQSYVKQVTEHILAEEEMQAAVLRSIGNSDIAMAKLMRSDEAMSRVGQSGEAMSRLAHSDEAMSTLARSDEAMTRLAQSEEAMTRLAQSEQAIANLAKSDEAMQRLAQSEEAMSRLVHSDQAISSLAKSDEAMTRLAQSEEAMTRLAQSDQAIANLAKSDVAMQRLAQSEEAMRKLLGSEMFEIWKAHQSKPKP